MFQTVCKECKAWCFLDLSYHGGDMDVIRHYDGVLGRFLRLYPPEQYAVANHPNLRALAN